MNLYYRVYNQRYQYKKKSEGKDVPLNDERIQKLDSIGFCWKAKLDGEWRESDRDRRRENSQDSWESKFERLVRFKEKHGKFHILKSIDALVH